MVDESLSILASKILDAARNSSDRKVRVISLRAQAKVQAGTFSEGGEGIKDAVNELVNKGLIRHESGTPTGTMTYVVVREKKK